MEEKFLKGKMRLLVIVFALAMAVGLMPLLSVNAYAAENTYSWDSENHTLTFTGSGELTNATVEAAFTYVANTIEYSGTLSVIISGYTSIGNQAFYYRDKMTSVTIPEGVTTIGVEAFIGCKGITSIHIPKSVDDIEYCAFKGCSGIESITVNSENPVYKSENCNVIISFAAEHSVIVAGCKNSTIPEGVTGIEDYAFYGCTGLTGITIPASVKVISHYAFYGCTGLTEVTMNEGLEDIGYYSFGGCDSLTSINIPKSVYLIYDTAFKGCSGLTSITVHSENAYYSSMNKNVILGTGNNNLIAGCNNSEIPAETVRIEDGAFYGCTGLTSISIPKNVTTIETAAFAGCSGITSIVVDSENTYFDSRNNCNAIIETSSNKLIAGCKNTTIPADVVTINESAFYGCTGLTSITIPGNITAIGNNAFNHCSNLSSITFESSTLPTAGSGAFAFVKSTGQFKVPVGTNDTNKNKLLSPRHGEGDGWTITEYSSEQLPYEDGTEMGIDVGFDNGSSYYLSIPTGLTPSKTITPVSIGILSDLYFENIGDVSVHDGSLLYTDRVKVSIVYDGKLKYGNRVAKYKICTTKKNESGAYTQWNTFFSSDALEHPSFFYAYSGEVEGNTGKVFPIDITYDATDYVNLLQKTAGEYKTKVTFSACIEDTGLVLANEMISGNMVSNIESYDMGAHYGVDLRRTARQIVRNNHEVIVIWRYNTDSVYDVYRWDENSSIYDDSTLAASYTSEQIAEAIRTNKAVIYLPSTTE